MVTRAKRDYYAVLGVPRDADGVAIKKAFRALATEFHPDVSDEPDAEERFRELTEAYEVLSRPEARERYDRFGQVTRGISGASATDGLFDDLIDLVTAAPRPGQRGADIIVEAEIDFVDATRGTSRGLRYSIVTTCAACQGEGIGAGGTRRVCLSCGGIGRVREVASGPSGRLLQYRACSRCGSTGRLVTHPCHGCGGRGRVEEERAVLIRIPPGTKDGARIQLAGEGHAGGPGGEPGDVYVEVRVPPPPDSPALRRLAAAGVVCGVVLGILTFVLLH